MWFLVAMFVVGFVLTAFLTPKMKVENAKASGLDEFQVPRSKEGDPVGRAYGTVKLTSPNTITLHGFKAEPIRKKVKTGLFSAKRVVTGFRYIATIDLAWCLGPGVMFRRMWSADNLIWSGCRHCETYEPQLIDLPELYGGSDDGKRGGLGGQVVMYCGKFDQPRDPYLATNVDPDVPAYRGVAHTVFRNFWWGNSPNVDNISAEVTYFTDSLGLNGRHRMSNDYDANPIEVLHDILTNGWGNLGFDALKINTSQWRQIAFKVYNEGIGISVNIANATQGTELCKQILRQLNAIVYEDTTTGLVEIALLRHDYVLENLPVLTPNEISECRDFTKKLWSETNNTVRVKYTDRADNYARDKIAVAQDSSLLRYQGQQRPVDVTMIGLYVAQWANAIAARELSNLNIPLFSCSLVCNRMPSDLRPGSPFILQWPEYGVQQMVMRVRKMNLGTLENGKITFSCVQDEFSLDAVVIAAPAPSGYIPTSLLPVDITEFVYFELPAFLDYKANLGTRTGYTRFAVFAMAPTSYTIGFNANVEQPSESATVLTLAPYTDVARLVTPIERFDGWDNGLIPEIIITGVNNEEALTVFTSPRQGDGLILIGTELFAYEDYEAEGDDFVLKNVHRAFFDTGWEKHLPDARVWFFDGQESFFETDSLIGDNYIAYLQDRTASGSSAYDTAVKTFILAEGRVTRVIAPDYATADGIRDMWQEFNVGDTVSIDARPRNRNDVVTAWYETDAASTAEPDTTYRISVEVNGVVTEVDDDVTLPYALTTTDDMEGNCIVLIEAKREGLYSIAATPMPIRIIGDSITVDFDAITIDNEKVQVA